MTPDIHGVHEPGHAHGLNRESLSAPTGRAWRINGAGSDVGTGTSVTGISLYAAVTGIGIYGSGTGISIQSNGGGAAHPNVQPTIVFNKIIFAGD